MNTLWRYLAVGALLVFELSARPAAEQTNATGSSNTNAGGAQAGGAAPTAEARSTKTNGTGESLASAAAEQELAAAGVAVELTESLRVDKERLAQLQAELEDPEGDYAQAEKAVAELRTALEALQKKPQAADQTESEARSKEADQLRTKLKLAEERLKLGFEERKTKNQQVKVLQQKIQKAEQIVARLSGKSIAAGGPGTSAGTVVSNAPAAATTTGPETAPAVATPSAPVVPTPAAAAVAAATEPSGTAPAAAPATEQEAAPVLDLKLREAKAHEAAKKAEAEAAAQDAQLVQDKIITAQRDVESEEKLLEMEQKKARLAGEEIRALENELRQKRQAGASPEELTAIETKLADTQSRQKEAQDQIQDRTADLDKLKSQLGNLDKLQSAAVEVAEARKDEADQAQAKVKNLENPFHPRNLLQWLLNHGPNVGALVLLMFLANLGVRLMSRRLVNLVARASSRGSQDERENRAQTLVSVFQSTASIAILVGGAIMVLDEVGVPVGPLLGGAAILGLAVAFGAQRLIADFFHGFVMLLENQYKVNDVIRVAGISGLVERITLRVTVLRDLEGILHFIPNSEIKTVSNMTHGWSRALFEIGVAYKEDADRVMEILLSLGKELRQDPKFSRLILDDPEMLGLDAMADSAIVIKFFIKTRPLQQWTVKREMLRRIKRRFDELGIEIPFPHRTVYVRSESAEPLEVFQSAAADSRAGDGQHGPRRGRRPRRGTS